jgi:hypothetical protein
MTLIYDNFQKNKPQVHVMVIGVGKYPHLQGGDRKLTTRHLGLGQLTSPPISARYFCNWFLEEYDNPDRTLGSVELLLSEAEPEAFVLPDEQAQIDVEPARMSAVRNAFDRWLKRCQAHPDNLAMFYFCGHGAQISDDHLLLLEDYGRNAKAPFRGAIDFNQMWRGFSGEVAGHKCFFPDACSNVSINDQDIRDTGAEGFLPTTTNYRFAKNLTVIRAAVEGSSAYGQENKESRFVQALVDCLNGRGAIKRANRWVITNQSLTLPLSIAMGEINEDESGIAQVHSPEVNRGEVLLQVPKATPQVPVVIEFDPSDAIDAVQLKLVSVKNAKWKLVYPDPQGGSQLINSRWMPGRMPSGFYRLAAQFQNKPYRAIEDDLIDVCPPGPIPSGPILLEALT